MAVWRTQDTAPLHDVDKTLLHLALRQNEAKRQKWRRIERWMIYVLGAGIAAGLTLCLAVMIHARDRKVVTGWDFVIGIGGAVAAVISARAVYVGHRAQALREQSFGESLRDQLERSIAQLDYQATTLHRTIMLVLVLLTGICPIALYLFIGRINGKSMSDDGLMTVTILLACVFGVALGVWSLRQQRRDVVLPRQRRLEALLKELDGR